MDEKRRDIHRPPQELIEALRAIGATTAAGTMAHMGIRNTYIQGPVSWHKGRVMCGPALTLLFMPKREDLYGEGEYTDPESSFTAMCWIRPCLVTSWWLTRAATCRPVSSAR